MCGESTVVLRMLRSKRQKTLREQVLEPAHLGFTPSSVSSKLHDLDKVLDVSMLQSPHL